MNISLPQDRLAGLLTLWLPRITTVILVLAIAYLLTQITWQILAPADTEITHSSPTPSIGGNTTNRANEYADQIAKSHLFGETNASAVTPEQAISAPDTKLNLQLKGILALGDKDGLAIITGNGGNDEKVYGIGDKIPGNATLKAVYADRVLLESSRGLETLRLPQDEALITFNNDPGAANASENSQSSTDNAQILQDYRRRLIRNPKAIAELAEISPVEVDGQFTGYKISPLVDDPVFATLGLQPNDIVVSVNNIDLSVPANGIKALRGLMKAPQIDISVLRDGQIVDLQHQFAPQ